MIRNLFLLLSFLFIQLLHAQLPHAEHFSIENGLFSNEIYQIEEDNKGFIWAATENGVSKFNSHGIQNYTINEGLNSNDVTAIFKDKNGTLWFGCFASFPNYLSNGIIKNSKDELPFEGKAIETKPLHFDKWKKELYLTYNINDSQSCVYNLTNKTYVLLDFTNKPLYLTFEENNQEHYLINGTLYEKNKHKLVINIPFDEYSRIRPPITYLHSYEQLNSKNTYVNFSEKNTIDFYSVNKKGYKKIKSLENNLGIQRCISTNNKYYFIADNQLYEESKDSFIKTLRCQAKIRYVFLDRNENLWVATMKGGIYLYRKNAPNWVWQISDRSLFKKLELFNNNLYISSYEKLGRLFNGDLEKLYETPDIPYAYSLKLHSPSKSHLSVTYGNKDHLTIDNKNNIINGPVELGAIKDMKVYSNSEAILGMHNEFCLYDIKSFARESIWKKRARKIVQLNDSIYLLVGISEARIYNLYQNKLSPIVDIKTLTHFNAMQKGFIALSSMNSLYLFNKKMNKVKELSLFENSPTNIFVNSIKTTKNNEILIATNLGWYIYKLGDNNKLIKLHQSNLSDLGKEKNIIDLEIQNDKLYYITDKILFNMELNHKKNKIDSVFCDAIISNNAIIPSSKYENISRSNNNLNIKLNYTTTTNSYNESFYYKLEGLSDNWNLSSTSSLNFNELNPGEYTLKIKSSKFENNEVFTVTKFTISPYFYETIWFKTICFILLFCLLFLLARYLVRRKNRLAQLELEHQKEVSELELRSLRASMNPHFIFNSLNSIQYYYVKNDVKSANMYLSKFSRLIRKILKSSFHSFITLEKEIELLRDYLELEKMRMQDKLSYSIEYDEKILNEDLELPQMLLQPFVENAILHGLEESGTVEIRFKKQNNKLFIEIEDDGIGVKASIKNKTIKDNNKHSIKINENRIKLLKSYYKKDVFLEVIDKSDTTNETGTLVKIKLPLYLK